MDREWRQPARRWLDGTLEPSAWQVGMRSCSQRKLIGARDCVDRFLCLHEGTLTDAAAELLDEPLPSASRHAGACRRQGFRGGMQTERRVDAARASGNFKIAERL